jgi:hypothetical protein
MYENNLSVNEHLPDRVRLIPCQGWPSHRKKLQSWAGFLHHHHHKLGRHPKSDNNPWQIRIGAVHDTCRQLGSNYSPARPHPARRRPAPRRPQSPRSSNRLTRAAVLGLAPRVSVQSTPNCNTSHQLLREAAWRLHALPASNCSSESAMAAVPKLPSAHLEPTWLQCIGQA